ncbi:SusE domain-containing protein [Flavobacterium sp. K5-23]|uniref:SusE domain-containing protein n=1 Tax=Flavobacterium sp. K5-23 TaxID=2746225 RepID=UPI0020101F1C|nr:SusE domain-containing protein [Flavobacterium sp. K5-23]UQD55897.1 SusE domain-containing protein [Flavobacterium sp. K5-23]
MKKIFLNLFLVTAALISMVSCTDETLDPVATVAKNVELNTPAGGNYVLTASTAGATALTVKWSSADFGYSAAVTYSLQVVKATADFSSPQSFGLGSFNENTNSNYEKVLTQRQLNSMLLGAGGAIGASGDFKMRVVAVPSTQLATSSNGVTSMSKEVTFKGNPYDTYDEFDRIYVPGSYGSVSTFGFWDPANAARLFSANNNGKYEGFVWMNEATPAFKFTPTPDWPGDKGDLTENPNTFTTLGGKNIKPVDGAGTYFFTVDWAANTYTIGKRQVAIIGQATPNGWGAATYLDFDTNPASPYYRMYTKNLALVADEFLVRLKDDWSVKMGTLSGNGETISATTQNKIKLGGGNMKVPTAGNYKVVLDINNSANYNLRLIPN